MPRKGLPEFPPRSPLLLRDGTDKGGERHRTHPLAPHPEVVAEPGRHHVPIFLPEDGGDGLGHRVNHVLFEHVAHSTLPPSM